MLFILGIERSATTWVSNLMEAHPDTQVYVEPMSVYSARFNDWPDRFEQIKDLQEKANYFLSELDLVRQHKRWLLTKWFSNRYAWKLDLWLSNLLVRKKIASEAAIDFSIINFHRKTQPSVKKNNQTVLEVIKELRLNFNVQTLPEINPNARVVVVVRNPFANIQSIHKHIRQGNLAELKPLLLKHYGAVNEESIYRYWRDSYNTLLEQVNRSDIPFLVVNHTELLQNPDKQIKTLCDFAGLADFKIVLDYLQASNREGEGLHNTNRNHEDLLAKNREAREEILPTIKEVFRKADLHPKLQEILKSDK